MGALNYDRAIIHSLEASVGVNGVREDDEFMLDIFQERRRSFRLKRTKYTIKMASKFFIDYGNSVFHLPVFEFSKGEFELVLIPYYGESGFTEKSRYLLRSLGEVPFRLNGGQCFEAYLERGDVVDIGFNRIHFMKPKSDIKLVDNDSLLSDEIMKSSLNIVLEGETGTGKTTLARIIHEESGKTGAFVHLNLSSFSAGLIESELFGHVKGAFTGAVCDKKGAILEAHKGTLFLDEIDSLSLELQTKLLLFLDSHEVRAVGGNCARKSEVRLVFASGAKLKTLVDQKKMRLDFYYRLTSGVVQSLSSLRENPDRIRDLCLEFEKNEYVIISEELIAFYQQCPWPGNIRQLKSHLLKKKVTSNGKKIQQTQIDFDLLNERVEGYGVLPDNLRSLEEIKMDYCLNIFMKAEKNFKRASRILDISPNTLKALLKNRESLNDVLVENQEEII